MDQDYPESVWIPFIPRGATMHADLASGLTTLTRAALSVGSETSIDRTPVTITNTNVVTLYGAANDADYDETFQWVPEASGKIDKFYLSLAMFANLESVDGGSITLTSVKVTITREGGDDVLWSQVFPTGFSSMNTDEDTQLFIIQNPVWGADMKIRAGNPLNIRIEGTTTVADTVVFRSGMVTFFPPAIPAAAADPQLWGYSGIEFFISRDQPERETLI